MNQATDKQRNFLYSLGKQLEELTNDNSWLGFWNESDRYSKGKASDTIDLLLKAKRAAESGSDDPLRDAHGH